MERSGKEEMKITIYSDEGITIVVGAKEVEIQTNKGLSGDPIPDEEWSQGFRFKEWETENV